MSSFGGLRIDLQPLPDQLAEDLGGLDLLQPDVAPDGGLDAAVSEHEPHQFVVAGMPLQDDRSGGMAELVRRDPQSSELMDPLGYLAAQRDLAFRGAPSRGTANLRYGPAAE